MSVKIAFCGRERACGTTVNMLLTAYCYAGIYPAAQVLVQRQSGWCCIQKGNAACKIMFADCGNGQEKKAGNSLRKADLIVMNIRPQKELLDLFFVENIRSFAHRRLLLVSGYLGEETGDRQSMEQFYRANMEHTGWVPYSAELELAYRRDAIGQFVNRNIREQQTERNAAFFREVQRNLFLLCRQIERKQILTKVNP